jgi:ribosome-binding protein aMBF1 (putative translation factor)
MHGANDACGLSRNRDIIFDMTPRRSKFPGFDSLRDQRHDLVQQLVKRRLLLGLSQTEVAARMKTSQSAVARFEAGDSDARLSTLQRYAAAVGGGLHVRLTTRAER